MIKEERTKTKKTMNLEITKYRRIEETMNANVSVSDVNYVNDTTKTDGPSLTPATDLRN